MDFFINYILPVVLLVLGFVLLVKGSSLFVDSSSSIAKKLGVSQLFIALTIVAMGTSIPETAVSLMAAINGNAELSIGNIIGTNTLNILFILGITVLISPVVVSRSTLCFEIPIMIGTALVFPLLGYGFSFFSLSPAGNGIFSRFDGIVFLLLFGLYLLYLARLAKNSKGENALMVIENPVSWVELVLFLSMGLIFVIAGSSLVVRGATRIAENFGVPERVIGLTIVAFGTSLPEFATSITAVVKKQNDLAVGNIVGSNIYNMLFIGGIVSLVSPVAYNVKFWVDSVVCVATSLLLFVFALNKKKTIGRVAGFIMLVCYGLYFWYLL